MEITLNLMQLAAWGGMLVWALISLAYTYAILKRASDWGATDKFIAQIQKLIMANNIDRAIKLCNAAPNTPIAIGTKVLLVRANRPALELDSALAEAHGKVELTYSPYAVTIVTSLMSLLDKALLIAVVVLAADDAGLLFAGALIMILSFFGRLGVYRLKSMEIRNRLAVNKVYELLVNRINARP